MEFTYSALIANTKLNGDCWEWTKWTNGAYPKFHPNGTKRGVLLYAHIEICRITHGEPPNAKMVAMHSCDNPICIRPEHLKWGTKKQNTKDMMDKGRQNFDKWPDGICKRGHSVQNSGEYSIKPDGRLRCSECIWLRDVAQRLRRGASLGRKVLDRLERLGYTENMLRTEFHISDSN